MNNHEKDYFWVEKNTDKRYTKNQYVVIGRGNLKEAGGKHRSGLTYEEAVSEAGSKNSYATSNAKYLASLKEG